MKIDEHYSLKSDKNNWVLTFVSDVRVGGRGKYSGKECRSKEEWYFPKLEMAIEKYSDQVLRTKRPKTIEDLTAAIYEVKHTIAKLNLK